jgi:hypothetical protein
MTFVHTNDTKRLTLCHRRRNIYKQWTVQMKILELLGSIQRGLLGRVTPNLRAVYMYQRTDKTYLNFYYDRLPSKKEEELVSLAHTAIISDFPTDEINFTIFAVPYPLKVKENDFCVYERFEENLH